MTKHKAGFINIIGNPNVGKSTLMNALVGERLSIITSKAQTTRHRILGIVNGEDFQIIYSDTPGIIKPHYKLQEKMMGFVNTALTDADIILYITDIVETPDKSFEYLERIKKSKTPLILVINKIDLAKGNELKETADYWLKIFPEATLIPVSALKNINVGTVLEAIMKSLPENPPFYPKDELTDKSERFFMSEIIREKILLYYQQEIPYSVEVEIESFKEEKEIVRISSIIYVIRESQKGIIIGKQGASLKKVGTEARMDMEKFLGKKVFLELFVKVRKDCRNNVKSLKDFVYLS